MDRQGRRVLRPLAFWIGIVAAGKGAAARRIAVDSSMQISSFPGPSWADGQKPLSE
jgi:hypothetical protein